MVSYQKDVLFYFSFYVVPAMFEIIPIFISSYKNTYFVVL